MKILSTALLLLALGSGAALAQTATPAAPDAPAPAAPAPAAAIPAAPPAGAMPDMKTVRAQCRDQMKGGGLKGDARRDAMVQCISAARPDKAAQVKCAMDPQTKGLAKDAKRAFVKDCVAKTKG